MSAALKRLAAVSASLLMGLLAAEGLARWTKPEPYAPIVSMMPGGNEVPISEIMHFVRRAKSEGISGDTPRAWAPANRELLIRYDRPRWDYFDENGCIRVTHNSMGFRDREFPVEKPEGELRILTIGDSMTYGIGVLNEDTWPQALERRIEEVRPGGAEVINGGFAAGEMTAGGYAPWLRAEGVRFDPELVIIGFCLNDFAHEVPMLAYPAVPRSSFDGPSELVNAVRHWRAQRRAIQQERDYADVVRENPEVWLKSQAGLVEMRDLLAERGIRYLVAVFPMVSGLQGDYPYETLHRMIDDFCEEQEIACVDLLPLFRGLDDRQFWVHDTDQHMNPAGHRLIADGVFAYLEQQGLLR